MRLPRVLIPLQSLRPVPVTVLVTVLATVLVVLAICWSQHASNEPRPGPAIWKVEGGDAELYLFGTFHLLPRDLEWQNETIAAAMAASDTLVLEADTSNEAKIGALVQKYAFNPKGKTLRSYFKDDEVERIDAALKPWGMSVDGAAALKPWFVSLQAGLTAMFSLGFDPDSGVEQVFLAAAKENPMDLGYLESGEAGIRALADHPDQVQAKILLASIEDLVRIEQMMRQMIDAWSQGDVAAVAEILNTSMAKTPELIDAVLYKRNRNWIGPLKTMLESDGKYFVAVGAGHLAGENNVIELLENEGYRIVRQ